MIINRDIGWRPKQLEVVAKRVSRGGERAWIAGVAGWVLVASGLAWAYGERLELPVIAAARDWLGTLDAAVSAAPVTAAAAYTVAGVVGGAVGLPPPSVVGMTGGAVFGLGVALPWSAATVLAGASLGFLAARGWLRPWLERRLAGGRTEAAIRTLQAGVAAHGGAYLLSLRLTPLLPNNLTNVAMGLANMPARSFVWATLVGRLPAAYLYCQAGEAAADAVATGRILTPRLIAALAVAALLPLASRLGGRMKANEIGTEMR
jgi:uncharacterized membrane protein YdjX (TVP38/TMEM64 family)